MDMSWGPHYGRGSSRLVSDDMGRLFLTVRDSLFIGERSGTAWTAAKDTMRYPSIYGAALSASPTGMVLWHDHYSVDRGDTWYPDSLRRYRSAYTISAGGVADQRGLSLPVVRSKNSPSVDDPANAASQGR